MTVVYPEAFKRIKKIREKSRALDVVPSSKDLAMLRLVMRKVKNGSMRLRGVSFHSSKGVVNRAIIEVVTSEKDN